MALVYRLNDNTVIRSGYGITYNPIPWARPLRGPYPAMIGALVPGRNLVSAVRLADRRASRQSPEPDIDSGKFPLPNTVSHPHAGSGQRRSRRIQSWNVAFERRLPWDLAVDVAYVGNRSDGGYADLDINAPTVVGGGNASRPYFVVAGPEPPASTSWGQRLKTRYNALQVAVNRPFTKGLLLKGAYTLASRRTSARRRRLDGPGVQHAEPDRSQLLERRLRPAATTSRWASSTSSPGERQRRQPDGI